MAQFRYLGEPHFGYVQTMGKSMKFKVPKKDGTKQEFDAPDPDTGFVVGDIIETTDSHSIRVLSADPRFEPVV
jgi:hypothetical protein